MHVRKYMIFTLRKMYDKRFAYNTVNQTTNHKVRRCPFGYLPFSRVYYIIAYYLYTYIVADDPKMMYDFFSPYIIILLDLKTENCTGNRNNLL